MSAGTPIQNFERATSIPDNSLHLVEMGDGSGTKAVTQEVLEKKIGEALKVGDLEELQTENKTSLVAAINEAAQSGDGGASVDILDTKEEIEANTEAGKAAGALAVQGMFTELNDNLQGFHPVIDPETGQITGYKTAIGGADTVFPFSSISKITVKLRRWGTWSYDSRTLYDTTATIVYTKSPDGWTSSTSGFESKPVSISSALVGHTIYSHSQLLSIKLDTL